MMPTENPGSLGILLQEQGGLFSGTVSSHTNGDEPRMTLERVGLGDVGVLWPEIAKRGNAGKSVHGAGAGLSYEEALIPALAEGLERYSTCVFRSEQFVWAAAGELGIGALDLDTVPRCSVTELAHPKCPLILPDKTKPIRWVRGLSALDGSVKYIPVVMVYSHAGFAVSGERFWISISTGCAAHVSYESALFAGICEVIERDAISIVWLQKLALPRIELDCLPPPLPAYWRRYENASADVEYLFFDATSDLGVPTVYGLQLAMHNSRVTTLVSCGTGTSIPVALAKVIRDMAAIRCTFPRAISVPTEWDSFTDVMHGATYMASADRLGAFDFLTKTKATKRISEIVTDRSSQVTLQSLVDTLKRLRLETYIVDLTTDEAIRAGMRVLRVIIPGLQPLSFRYRARYLGHPRLYEAPLRMGYPAHPENQLNDWPQPFA